MLELTAQVQAKLGQHRKALELCIESLPAHKAVLGNSANRTIEMLTLMGELHESLGEHTKAHERFEEAFFASRDSPEASPLRTQDLKNRLERASDAHSASGS